MRKIMRAHNRIIQRSLVERQEEPIFKDNLGKPVPKR